jgi:polar amino acid transport system substrate-binding protein
MTITEERKQNFAFSEPYFAAGQVVTVQAANADITGKDSLTGKRVGAQNGTTGDIEIQKMAGVERVAYDDIGLAFQDLINGQIDAVVADNPLALGYIGQNPDKIKTAGEVFTDEYYGIAACKTKTDLLAKVNKGLAAVQKTDTIEKLTNQWLKGGN